MTVHDPYGTSTILVPTVSINSLLKDRKKAAAAPSTPAAPKSNVAPVAPAPGWELKPIQRSERSDLSDLRHWQKKGLISDDPFNKFNKKLQFLTYTAEEYVNSLTVTDWTKQDTDELLKLVQRFDMNFFLVSDRWPASLAPRTMEALKDRFYAVQRRLATERGLATEADAAESVLLSQPFNKDHEAQRKQQMDRYYACSKADAKRDAEVLEQARLIEAAQRRRKGDVKKAGAGAAVGAGAGARQPDAPEVSGPACPPGGVTLRSLIMTRTPDQAQASKWLDNMLLPLVIATQETQKTYAELCDSVTSLLDMHKKLTRRKKEKEQLLDRKQELVRPAKKRKTAPSQRLLDGASPAAVAAATSGVGGGGGGAGTPSRGGAAAGAGVGAGTGAGVGRPAGNPGGRVRGVAAAGSIRP